MIDNFAAARSTPFNYLLCNFGIPEPITMDLKQLEFFVRVAETGSFTRAAALLAVAQPALSKQVRRLEVELRQTLFNRNGRGVTLTQEGTLLLQHARGIIEQVVRARDVLDSAKHFPVGKVVIATPQITGKALSAGLVTTFRERFPRASLEIIEGKSRFILEWLFTGRIDIGILYDPPVSPLLEITPLANHELSLFSLPSHTKLARGKPVPFKDLGRFPLILPSHPHTIRALVESEAAKAGIELNVAMQIDGASFILELVQLGHGCAILPAFSLQRTVRSRQIQLNDIVSPRLKRSLKVAVSLQRPVTRLARETIKLIRQFLGPGSEIFER
jgi:LysR family nitrogen assimilation transcriptional regulator